MKYYARFLFIGALTGFFCILVNYDGGREIAASSVILCFSHIQVGCSFSDAYQAFFWFIPLILFQIFYGTYIYRHFSSAGIYFFSRNINRTAWFLAEAMRLYVFSLAYSAITALSGILAAAFLGSVSFDGAVVIVTVYYLAIYSLYLFAVTLGINVLSVLMGSNFGFTGVAGFELMSIALFMLMGDIAAKTESQAAILLMLLNINPYTHIVFSVHSSKNSQLKSIIETNGWNIDFNSSVLALVILSLIIVIVGCIAVNRCNFLVNDRETVS